MLREKWHVASHEDDIGHRAHRYKFVALYRAITVTSSASIDHYSHVHDFDVHDFAMIGLVSPQMQ